MAATQSRQEKDTAQADFNSLEQAARWYSLLYAGDAPADQTEAWKRWLQERQENQAAWQQIEAVSRKFTPLREPGQREAASLAVHASAKHINSKRRTVKTILALGGLSVTGWLAASLTPLPGMITAWRADHHTGVGERRELTLADGTRVWLNTASAVDVAFDAQQRLIKLHQGEILIDTAKDGQGRPFYVDTPFGRLQALGTRFTVRQSDASSLLVVYEGRVSIQSRTGQTAIVEAGWQRAFSAAELAEQQPADLAREAWSRGILLANRTPLAELINEITRYQYGHIALDPRIAGIKVIGRYPIDQPDRVLAMLERDLPIRVERPIRWLTSIGPR